MNEASAIKSLKKKLEENDFYVKKLADKSTKGLPDSFVAKEKKGIFLEFKFIEFDGEIPLYFNNWAKIGSNDKMVQLTTMQELNTHFLARYVLIYQRPNAKEAFFAFVRPSEFLSNRKDKHPVPISLLSFNQFLARLHLFLQI